MISLMIAYGCGPDPDSEQKLIDRIAIDQVLEQLPDRDRELIWLQSAYDCPDTYTLDWPPSPEDIAGYIGQRYDNAPLHERKLRRHTNSAYQKACAIAKGTTDPSPPQTPSHESHLLRSSS